MIPDTRLVHPAGARAQPAFGLALALAAFWVPTTASAQAEDRELPVWASDLQLGDETVARIRSGDPVGALLATGDDREIAVAAVMRTSLTIDQLLGSGTQIEAWTQGERDVGGTFGAPPSRRDLAGLRLSSATVRDLEDCQLGSCAVKLPRRAIEQVRSFSRSGPPRASQVEAVVRDVLLARVVAAANGGAGAPYADKPAPLAPDRAFTTLVRRSPHMLARVPELQAFVEGVGPPPGGSDRVWVWAEEDFGLKPVISLSSVVPWSGGPTSAPAAMLVIEQRYASHYFEASLTLVAIYEDAGSADRTVVLLRHHRFDDDLGGVQRRLLEARIASYAERSLLRRMRAAGRER